MKPEWCPQWAWERAGKAYDEAYGRGGSYRGEVARALLDAHQRGRREGMEEAAKVAHEELERARVYHPEVALGAKFTRDAIQAQAQEVKT